MNIWDLLLRVFVSWWRLPTMDYKEMLKAGPEVIVAISYTTGRSHLMTATRRNLEEAANYAKTLSGSRVVYCSCESAGYPFAEAGRREHKLKLKLLRDQGITPIVGPHMGNTVDEAFNLRSTFDVRGFFPQSILICTGELHGPSALLVYKMIFPKAKIFVSTIPCGNEIQEDHPVRDQRTMFRWVMSNIKRQAALRACWLAWKVNKSLGLWALGLVRRIKHRSAFD